METPPASSQPYAGSKTEQALADVIGHATSSVRFSDDTGVEYTVTADQDNPFLRLEPVVLRREGDADVLGLKIRNISRQPLRLNRAAVIDISARNGGRLSLHGPMTLWTILMGGGVRDLCNEWHTCRKSNFYSPHYAVIGNNASGKYLTLGFVTFTRQDTLIHLKATHDACTFEHLKALCEFSGYLLGPGEQVDTGEVYLNVRDTPQAALQRYTDLLLQNAPQKPRFKDVIGWATWDYYQGAVTEADVLENAKWLAEHKHELPVEYIQVDHGFQIREGDWLTTNDDFPHGLKWLAEKIREFGFKPGLWLCPFLVAPESAVYKEHPDWVITNPAGKPLELNGYAVGTVYGLDCTRPGVCNWLKDLAATVTRDYGFDYIKLDGANAQAMSPLGVPADRKTSRTRAMEQGLQAFKQGMAHDAFLLNAGSLFRISIGLADAMRVGADVGARWDASKLDKHHGERDNYLGPGEMHRAIAATANSYFLHKKIAVNDPDYLIVRQQGCRSELTLEEARSWASLVSLSNGLVMLSDKMTDLAEERLDLLKKVLPHARRAAKPLDFFRKEVPSLYDLEVRNESDTWHVVCIVNVDLPKRTRDYEIPFSDLGLPEDTPHHAFDFWRHAYLGAVSGSVKVHSLPPHHCVVLCLREKKSVPHLIATDMHITQGGLEIQRSAYEQAGLRVKTAPCGKAGLLYLYLPPGYVIEEKAERAGDAVYSVPVIADGREFVIRINRNH